MEWNIASGPERRQRIYGQSLSKNVGQMDWQAKRIRPHRMVFGSLTSFGSNFTKMVAKKHWLDKLKF